MSYIKINGCNYFYLEKGAGSECLLFSHGLLWNHKMFEPQINHFKNRYRIIAYDHRGQGESEVTTGGYDMDQLYRDSVELISQLNLHKVHFIGLSMGGFVGLRLAARNPELVKSLILLETTANPEPNKIKYLLLNTVVKLFGARLVSSRVMKIMFGHTFLSDDSRIQLRNRLKNELDNLNKSIVKAVDGVIHRKGVENELQNISCPTLIMVGNEDIATVPEKSEFMHQHISNSKLVRIENAGHTSCLENPDAVNKFIGDFLTNLK